MNSAKTLPPLNPPLSADEAALRSRLHKHVEVLAGLIGPRYLGLPRSMVTAQSYLEAQLTSAGFVAARQEFACQPYRACNLETSIGPANDPLIVGAHYDTVPTTPGADDNASAVAACLEIAAAMRNANLSRQLRFVLFTNEEPPYYHTEMMGSLQYAERCRQRGENVEMICLESLGYFSSAEPDIPVPVPRWVKRVFVPKSSDWIAIVSNLRSGWLRRLLVRGMRTFSGVQYLSHSLPERVSAIGMSDNWSFWRCGFPAVMVTNTAAFRNPNYHARSDTPDTLDYDRLTRVTSSLIAGVRRMTARN